MLWLETLLSVGTEGCSAVLPVYGLCALLTMIIPGKHVKGYACDREGVPLDYKLNGLSVMIFLVAGWFQAGYPTYLAEKFWSCFGVAFGLGMIGSAYCVWGGSRNPEKYSRCATADKPEKPPKASTKDLETWNSRTTLGHFFYGLEFNPRWTFPGLAPLDVKMYLYVVGATYLALNVLSAAALQATLAHEGTSVLQFEGSSGWSLVTQHSSTGTKLYVWMMGWFLCDYLWFEELHLYTYDLFCEKLGFKLFWGCTCFYPFFYCVGIWSLLGTDVRELSSGQVVRILTLFYSGWILTRGSNLQKFWFKQALREQRKSGSREKPLPPCFLGLVPQTPIRPGSALVCSGFWGLSRHVNYLGETLQAVALALPGYMVSGSFVPFLYPLYYVALFVPRAMDDGSICAAKYGAEWEEYVQKVPYKIVPGIY